MEYAKKYGGHTARSVWRCGQLLRLVRINIIVGLSVATLVHRYNRDIVCAFR